jgi:ribosomal protein L11 methyltransferase
MVSVEIPCHIDEKDELIADLLDSGTGGIQEKESLGGDCTIEVYFDTAEQAAPVLEQFAARNPRLIEHGEIDYVAQFQQFWEPVAIGNRWWLAAPWDASETPPGRIRIDYQAGMACGTGAHPCTQLCLEALDRALDQHPNPAILDVGAGSGILLMASRAAGVSAIAGCDIEADNMAIAHEAGLPVFIGSTNAVKDQRFDIVIANISSEVAEELAEEWLRVAKPNATLILSGFREDDLPVQAAQGTITTKEGWAAVTLSRPPSSCRS